MDSVIIEAIKLVLSAALGFIIGFEREKNRKPAGSRTLAIVSVGACFVTIIGLNYAMDVGRVLQGIITGIGFLGAGAIIAQGTDIKGITTAASVWSVAIVGIGVGIGQYLLSIGFSALVFLILLERRIEVMTEKLTSKGRKKRRTNL